MSAVSTVSSVSEKQTAGILTRLIVCVDGSEYSANGRLDNANASNVFRLKSALASGTCYNPRDQAIQQKVKYFRAVGDGRDLFGKLKSRLSAAVIEQQIREIVKQICETDYDELAFYGFGRGAYIVRAVAGLLHHMGQPKSQRDFEEVYRKALDLEKAVREDDSTNGPKIVTWMKQRCHPCAPIIFLGVFDTVKTVAERHIFDISFVPSIRNARHALAFNEVRVPPELFPMPRPIDMDGRTFIQAWFVGAQQDLGGASRQDGLSLYPLQWMIVESMRVGIVFESDGKVEKVISLAFPQFAGSVPKLGDEERVEWQVGFKNGIQVSMYDLQSLHAAGGNEDHSLKMNAGSAVYNRQRQIFDSNGLVGWSAGEFIPFIYEGQQLTFQLHLEPSFTPRYTAC